MCRNIVLQARDDDGNPHPGAPQPVEFDSDLAFERWGVCTCWLGSTDARATGLRHDLMEDHLRPLLERVTWGKVEIIII